MIVQRIQPRHADGDVDQAFAPRPAERIGDNHGAASQARSRSRRADASGSIRQYGCEIIACDIRLIDARIGADEPVLRLGDDDAAIHFHDAPRLSQDQFDQARVFVPLGGPGSCERRRLDLAQIDNCAFRFRNDFLRHCSTTVGRCIGVLPRPGGSARPRSSPGRISGRVASASISRRMQLAGKSKPWHSCGRAKNSATSSGVSMSNINPGRRSTSAGKPLESA